MHTVPRNITFGTVLAVLILIASTWALTTASAAEGPDTAGVLLVSALLYPTDATFIEQSATLGDGISKVARLNPVSFIWKDGRRKGEEDIGFIAQEVEEIVPEVVHTDANGMKYVDYAKLIPILVIAMQENQVRINDLKAAVAERKKAMERAVATD